MTDWTPDVIDVTRPSTARMYDYYLGGKDNFAADRDAADRALAANPDIRALALANRDFLVRAVRFMAEQGIRQFIDVGTGIPTSPNVHEIARQTHPDASVVYADNDPIVMVHNRAWRETRDGVIAIQADLRRPANILNHPSVQRLIDFDQPVGLLIVSVMHFVGDSDDPPGIIGRFRDQMTAGSHLALSSATTEGLTARQLELLQHAYTRTGAGAVARSRDRILDMFAGFDLVDPGLTPVQHWRSDGPPTTTTILAAVGRR